MHRYHWILLGQWHWSLILSSGLRTCSSQSTLKASTGKNFNFPFTNVLRKCQKYWYFSVRLTGFSEIQTLARFRGFYHKKKKPQKLTSALLIQQITKRILKFWPNPDKSCKQTPRDDSISRLNISNSSHVKGTRALLLQWSLWLDPCELLARAVLKQNKHYYCF